MPRNTKKIRREVQINGANIWVTADNEQDYANKLLRLSGGLHQQTDDTPFFNDYADRWFYGVAKPNIAEVTAHTYRRQLDLHINPVIGRVKLSAIDPFLIQQIFNDFGPDTRQDTKNKVKCVLNQIFKMAVDEDLIRKNPMDSSSLHLRGQAAITTEPYTVAEMRYFVAHLEDVEDPTDRAWLALSVCLPLRPEEVLGLRWEDVDEDNLTVTVQNTVTHPDRNQPVFKPYTKTASSRRRLSIPQRIIDLLPERGEPWEFVVGGSEAISYTQLRWIRKRVATQIGYDGQLTPRRFRTTVATDVSALTHDLKLVQRMLGHSTPQMTLKHYDKGRSTIVDGRSAIEECYGF